MSSAAAVAGAQSAFHLYPIRLDAGRRGMNRTSDRGTAAPQHRRQRPFHSNAREPIFLKRRGYRPDQLPVAEETYRGWLSLPIYTMVTDRDAEDVVASVGELAGATRISARRNYE